MKKNKVVTSIITLLLSVILVFFIAETYSRYLSEGRTTLTTDVAKWAISISSEDEEIVQYKRVINFSVRENANIASDKIAPGGIATAIIELDLTGTEVAVEFNATIDESAFSYQNIGQSYDKIALSTKLGNTTLVSGEPQLINLENGSAFTAQNGIKTITLQLTWENDNSNNSDDTSMAFANKDISIPINLTVKQHLNTDTISAVYNE